ncbi:alpha/beta fold hydrolase [Streptomyces cyaneofuscatus]|uniref:effector-associated domain 2-containing protein n=1 Tax=Streptomyces TaxID=1883 RepID=UPI00386E0A34|nr:alpha/beta fold hydrolase [Streptomyces cyaneofuscatus]
MVFIHGFNSSAEMWDPLLSWMRPDEGLRDVTALPFSYDTRLWQPSPLRQIPSFDTVADSLKEFLVTEAERFDHLMLVCHSQGGLVAQRSLTRMLVEGRGKDMARILRVVLLACPNNGSQLGMTLRRAVLPRNRQEQQLRPLDQQITDTQRTVLRDLVNAREVTERTCPIPFSVYAGETDNVVTPASALGAFPDASVLPGDHSGIVRTERCFATLRRLMLSALGTGTAAGQGPVSAASAPPAPPAVLSSTVATAPRTSPPSVDSAPQAPPAAFPDTLDIVRVAERVPDMDDPDFRRQVVALMRRSLAPRAGFTAGYRAHPRDHLLEIVERCRTHAQPGAALAAFRDAVDALRPDDAATVELRAMIKDPE